MATNNWEQHSVDNDRKDNGKEYDNESSSSVYNEKELEYLDKYTPLVKNAMDVSIILNNIRIMNSMIS